MGGRERIRLAEADQSTARVDEVEHLHRDRACEREADPVVALLARDEAREDLSLTQRQHGRVAESLGTEAVLACEAAPRARIERLDRER